MLVDIGEVMGDFGVPIYTYRNFPRRPGLTVEQSIAGLGKVGLFSEFGVQVPDSFVMDCIRLCCSLCLLENDPSIISPDVLADDRAKFEASGDQRYIDKAHRRGKVGWDVGKHIEVIPHFRRPHMMLVWTGRGRAVPRIVPRKGSIVHREAVEKLPSGFGGGEIWPRELGPMAGIGMVDPGIGWIVVRGKVSVSGTIPIRRRRPNASCPRRKLGGRCAGRWRWGGRWQISRVWFLRCRYRGARFWFPFDDLHLESQRVLPYLLNCTFP